MADEITQAPAPQEPNPAQERITQLSDKVRTSEEARTVAENKAAEAEKKVAFAEGYADVLGTYPAAKEFKADIQGKVMLGYSVEDATLAVLGKAGKLGTAPASDPINPTGGSATNAMPPGGEKSLSDMSTADKRAALADVLTLQ